MILRVAAFSILALTITIALRRPRIGRFNIAHAEAALLGALLVVGLKIVPPPLAMQTLQFLAAPIITIISLMVITLVAEEAGLFGYLAQRIACYAGGNARALFGYIFLTGTITGAFFTNDAAVLIFTPLVFNLIEQLQESSWTIRNKIPFYFSVLYVANVAGVFVISNPINIVVARLFDVTFLEYALWMMLPAIVSIVTSYAGLKFVLRKDIPAKFKELPRSSLNAAQRKEMGICGAVLLVTLVGLFCEEFTGIATWAVTLCAAVLLLCVHRVSFGGSTTRVFRNVGWDVVVFVVGIYIVAVGLRNVGLTEQVAALLHHASGSEPFKLTNAAAFTAGVVSAFMNNHPTADTMAFAIRDMDLGTFETKIAAFSALIGGDLGPKMLPTGSLAALMWFRILRNKGVHVSYWTYIKIGIPVTLAAIFFAVLVLNLELLLYYRFS